MSQCNPGRGIRTVSTTITLAKRRGFDETPLRDCRCFLPYCIRRKPGRGRAGCGRLVNAADAADRSTQAATTGESLPDTLIFDEAGGLVPVRQMKEGDTVVGGELVAPEPLSRRSEVPAEQVAACLSLDVDDIRTDGHPPQVVSVGLPFLVAELASRDALRRCSPNPVTYKATLPLDGAVSVYAYTRDVGLDCAEGACDLQARMFTPRMTEEPAKGSATAATVALLATLRAVPQLTMRVQQGVDMGRPSLLVASFDASSGVPAVRVGGRCVTVMTGTFSLVGEA
jgi:trans-2,3-dihydro-3-hydroxyanthranilate isomerase